jgi:hypothetical protein
MLLQVLTYHQVSPCYLNFLASYGSYSGASDLRFGGFRRHRFHTPDRRGPALPSLGRSGCHYQISFKLQTIQRYRPQPGDGATPIDKHLQGEEKWRKPTAVIYHQFDLKNCTALWICTSPLRGFQGSRPRNRLWKAIHDSIADIGYQVSSVLEHERFNASLSVALSIAEMSIGDCSFYLHDKEEQIFSTVSPVQFGRWSPSSSRSSWPNRLLTLACADRPVLASFPRKIPAGEGGRSA